LTPPADPAPPIRPAAVVRLRSGGPEMTVSRLARNDGAESAWCVWFEARKAMAATYPLDALLLVKGAGADDPPPKCGDWHCRQPPYSVIEYVWVTPRWPPDTPGLNYRREEER
jgi:uncharacterized protein YodC (DUF2158 family)